MTIEMIPLTKLCPSTDNPRKRFDDEAVAGLAQSIKTDGLLQNLVAAKPLGRKREYPIISGERRFRAMCLLVEQGHLPKDVSVPVEVREGLSDEEIMRIAAIENIQREDLTPLEEAEAIATLVGNGDGLDDISAQTGLSISTIKRRLALLDLSETIRGALASAQITLAQAEALTVGAHDEQDKLLDRVTDGWYSSPDDIRQWLIGQSPTVSMAIFPQEKYSGTFTTDLFGDDETTYFDDAAQFFELQKAAAEQLVTEYEQKCDWAEFTESRMSSLQYREAEEDESGGVVVQLCPSGKVEIHEGLIRNSIDASVSEALKPTPKSAYAKTVREYFAMHKSAAVQVELLSNPRKAKEIGVAKMLYRATVHDCYAYLANSEEGEAYLDALEQEATALLELLGRQVRGDAAFRTLLSAAHSVERAYDLVQKLDDASLDRLLAFLSIIDFGQDGCGELDTDERSVFNRVSVAVGVDMRKHWTPRDWFLSRRTMSQLQTILSESGLSRLYGNGKGYKKSELVPMVARYFAKVRDMKTVKPDQQQARDWLPEAMSFPAVDPDVVMPNEQATSHTEVEFAEAA